MAAAVLTLAVSARAADTSDTSSSDVSTELKALKARIAELEAKENQNWLTEERANQIRGIVQDVIKDAKMRGQFADGPEVGYKDGFYIQTADKNFKLVIGGFAQIRYEAALQNGYNGRTVAPGKGSQGNTSGFDIRRARISFSGNVMSPDLTYKFEGDFYGSSFLTGANSTGATGQSSGGFTVTDAYVAYRFTDMFRMKVGSYKVPFAKAELTSDTNIGLAARPEELFPFDPVRSLGLSLYGDIIQDKLGYEVAVNDGGNANLFRRDDTVGSLNNIDNRFGFYGRVQWAGSGKLADFTDEPDLRKDNREFIWLLGGAVGYESQNNATTSFPSPQSTTVISGVSGGGSGFVAPYTLNGDLFRGTIDWSAKYQGLSMLAALYGQQVNGNNGASAVPGIAVDSSFFQWGGYGQVGYFVIPQKLEVVGRAGALATEGGHDIGEFYTAGANYYVFGNNFKIMGDVTYTPEAAYTDSSENLLLNTHDVIFRLQLQLKF
jgi:hypothetical protein